MSDTFIIAAKLKRLINHLSNGGSEEDTARVIKIRDEEQIKLYLDKAREELGEQTKQVAKETKTGKAAVEESPVEKKSSVEEKASVEEEVLDDEEDDLDDDDLDEDLDDEDWDADPAEVEEEIIPAPKPAPKPAPVSEKEFFILDQNNVQQRLSVVSDKPHKTIFKVYQDTPVRIKVGTQEVEVMKDEILAAEGPMVTLPNGGNYPTEFVKAAVQLALL